MQTLTPTFNYKLEMLPFYKLVCKADNLKAEANFGQMKEIGKELALIIANDYNAIGIITVAKYMQNRPLISDKYYQKRIVPIIKKLCEADNLKSQANFGQMSEILKEMSIIFEEQPQYLAAMIRYSVHLKNN